MDNILGGDVSAATRSVITKATTTAQVVALAIASPALAQTRTETVTFGVDGQRVVGTLVIPDGPPAPVVVFLYGGSWRNGAREDYRFVGRRLAQQGMLVLVADYRTYPETIFPGFVEDGASAVAWARAHAAGWGGDPRCLFVAGHSAGAQIAAGETGA